MRLAAGTNGNTRAPCKRPSDLGQPRMLVSLEPCLRYSVQFPQTSGKFLGTIALMFEVIEKGASYRRWFEWPRVPRVAVKLRATKAMFCERAGRTFHRYGNFLQKRYRADFSEGEVIIIHVPINQADMYRVEDKCDAASLAANGFLKRYFRRIPDVRV